MKTNEIAGLLNAFSWGTQLIFGIHALHAQGSVNNFHSSDKYLYENGLSLSYISSSP